MPEMEFWQIVSKCAGLWCSSHSCDASASFLVGILYRQVTLWARGCNFAGAQGSGSELELFLWTGCWICWMNGCLLQLYLSCPLFHCMCRELWMGTEGRKCLFISVSRWKKLGNSYQVRTEECKVFIRAITECIWTVTVVQHWVDYLSISKNTKRLFL